MTCKDCDRRIVCRYYTQWANVEQIETDRCQYFKNKADFVEVKHGEWIVKTELKTPLSHAYIRKQILYICPYCNKQYRKKMNFCGNCGAKMDEERRCE